MRRATPLCVMVLLLVLACSDAPAADRADESRTAPVATTPVPSGQTTSSAAELVVEGVQALLDHYYQPLDAGRLFADAWAGAASAAQSAGAKDLPPAPTFPAGLA